MESIIVLGIVSLVVIVSQQVMIHRLINKMMSRNFGEYEQSRSIGKAALNKSKSKGESDAPEDLRILQEFTM